MEVSLLTGESKRTLETVKILHETVLALRTALEGSRRELVELRRISSRPQTEREEKRDVPGRTFFLESMDRREGEEEKSEDAFGGCLRDENKLDSGAESDDIDDIELVFTTGEADPGSIHEDLVPILEESGRKSSFVETDISKCGVVDENEVNLSSRRNTLPNPLPYRPIVHREILAAAAARTAPVRSPCKALQPGTQETGAQTDITALPAQWKSETYLAHKMSCNLTTLPSKFTLPVPQSRRLPLSDKTREARRVLLSDINFTSMVPELSRSADHLLHEEKTAAGSQTTDFEYAKSPGEEKRRQYSRQESRSSCGSHCGSRCHTSSASIPPCAWEDARRRHSWRPPQIVCCHSGQFWSSVPSSPIKCFHGEDSEEAFCHLPPRRRKPRVHFHCDPFGHSLPNLRLEADSGDSTDSLVDEAEEFLRRSIDNLILSKTPFRSRERSASTADYASDFEPPPAAQPFLPETARDLKRDCFVKVITPEGKIAVGRVRYSGPVPGKAEPHVGVELPDDSGFSDGAFTGHRFFHCEANHGVFVPFKKVVIAWKVRT